MSMNQNPPNCIGKLHRPRYGSSRGVSLIELMIALVLGLLLVGGILQLFMGSRMTYQSTEAVARVQENGRFVMSFIEPELRAAGSSGFCAGDIAITNHLDLADDEAELLFDASAAIAGWEFDGTGRGENYSITTLDPAASLNSWSGSAAPPSALAGKVVPGTDILMLRNLELQADITGDVNASNNPQATSVVTQINHGVPQCTIALITNCASGADLFQSTTAGSRDLDRESGCTPGNRTGGSRLDWSTSYADDMQLYLPRTRIYFIGQDSVTEEPGLYRMDMVQGSGVTQTEQLVSGIENMQVLYGLSLPASLGGDGQYVDEWLTADQVGSWNLIIAARVSFLVRSQENVSGAAVTQTYNLAGTNVSGPSDRRLRQAFSTTVAVRNRLLVN